MGKIKDLNADAFNIVDSPLAYPLMNPIALCHKIEHNLGTPTIMHFTCRDRNLIEIRSLLLAAKALDISNILALTGDKISERFRAKPVFEFSSIGLIRYIKELNEKKGTDFFIGCGANLNANVDVEIKRTKEKLANGAEFVMTQSCFSLNDIEKFIRAIEAPVFIGLLALYSKEEFEKLNALMPGFLPTIDFNDNLDEVYSGLIKEIKDIGAKGVSIMPFGNFEKAKLLMK